MEVSARKEGLRARKPAVAAARNIERTYAMVS